MLSSFKISRGHNLSLDGVPDLNIIDMPSPSKIIIHPNSINGIKPKLLIKKGDNVRAVVLRVEMRNNNPQIVLSRTSPVYLERLYKHQWLILD